MKANRKRSGFSLAEILVAIAIVAVVAAVVVPSIGSQLKSGDESRVQQDLTNVRAGIEQFLADVRRYPNSIGQLTNLPTTALSGLVGGVFSTSQVARWRGPYISKDSVQAVKTGFDLSMLTAFDTLSSNGIIYMRVKIPAFDSTSALRLDTRMDDGDLTTGIIRWVTTGSDTLYYWALPVQ